MLGPIAILSLAACLVTLASLGLAARRLSRRTAPGLASGTCPPVTIVRPLCGLEPFSHATLRSGFRLAYPAYELVFCVACPRDPVVPLVRDLMARHPEVEARLLVGDERVNANPKLNNCLKGWDAARHDWIVLADANVEMPRDYLQSLLAAWRPDTGLVCSMPIGTRPEGFWATVECAFLNTFQARCQYAAEALGFGFAQGKSMLWHRRLLAPLGGLRALAGEIAEDAAATKLVRAAGLRVHLVDRPFPQPIGRRRAADIGGRQLRWARLRRMTFPLLYGPEILTSPLVLAAAFAAGAPSLGLDPWLATAVPALCYGAEFALARRMGWPAGWRLPLACLTRDLLIPAIWVAAFLTRRVLWHGSPLPLTAPTPRWAGAEARP